MTGKSRISSVVGNSQSRDPGSELGTRPRHSGKCSPWGVRGSAGWGLGVVMEKKRAKAATLVLTSEWKFKMPGERKQTLKIRA